MIELLEALELHSTGIFVALAMLAGLGLFTQWIFWILGKGRFAPRGDGGKKRGAGQGPQPLRYTLTSFMTMLVNDFRHLLALVVVLLFAVMMGFAVWPGLATNDVTKVTDGVQTVSASMGGLLGSIIGYYFGAMAAKKPGPDEQPPALDEQPEAGPDEEAS
jgi:hypothetical protein